MPAAASAACKTASIAANLVVVVQMAHKDFNFEESEGGGEQEGGGGGYWKIFVSLILNFYLFFCFMGS